jgi:DNA polymerase I-like protein with 3'-5' exonuclease and polymerase domains
VTTVWANGIYDLFVLKHRCGVKFQARVDDAQIAWHSAYPELAGAKEDRKKHRFTRKSLSFLASLTTMDKWWKGDYETEEEFFVYNGKDCAITLDVWDYVMKAVEDVGAEDVYEHERSLMWPCVDMLARGLNVDDGLRKERVEALSARAEEVSREAFEVVRPLLDRVADELERLEVRHLFEETDPTCTCCGHGKKKQLACWACAGFETAPTKAEMLNKLELDKKTKRSKEDLARELLPVCHVCCGAPRETRWTFNANSTEQMKTLLYDVLRLPKKMKDGRPTVDEAALKALLGGIPT